MARWQDFRNHLNSLLWKVSVKEEVDTEIDFHIEMLARELMACGMSDREARTAALAKFGDVRATKKQCRKIAKSRDRRAGVLDWIEGVRQDAGFSIRQMGRAPLWTLLVVLSFAIGISANTVIFSVVNAVVLRPLPYPDAEQIVRVREVTPEGGTFSFSGPNLHDYGERSHSFKHLGGVAFPRPQLTLLGEGEPEELYGIGCTTELFNVFGVAPQLGRTFLPEDGDPRNPGKVMVISNGLWERRFAADRDVVGREFNINGETWTVIGVMPTSFRMPVPADVWIPHPVDPAGERSDHRLEPFARLKPGVSIDQARAELRAVAAQLSAEYPKSNGDWSAVVYPIADMMIGKHARQATVVLQLAVALMLLLACANVSNLIIARATAREQEIGIRVALGAGRSRLLRQLITESTFLSLLGAAVGLALAYWSLPLLVAWNPNALPRLDEVSLDHDVLSFSVLISIAAGLVAGVVPAIHVTRGNLTESLKGERHSSRGGARRLRDALVIGELALAMILLTGAGLLLNSFNRLQNVDPGFVTENILLVPLNLPAGQYPEVSAETAAFYRQVEHNIEAIPGVRAVGASIVNPFEGFQPAAKVAGIQATRQDEFIPAQWRCVTPDYFRVMSISLLRGRYFKSSDRPPADTEPAERFRGAPVIVSAKLAAQLWPGKDPIGEPIQWFSPEDNRKLHVVGVVSGIRDVNLIDEPEPMLFLPHEYLSWPQMTLMIKTEANPAALASAVRTAIWKVDKNLPAPAVRPLQARIESATAGARFNSQLFGLFALIALVMASLGIYGVLSYAVERRTVEISIRMALGARSSGMVTLILRHAAILVAFGLTAGLLGALGFTRFMESLLYETSPNSIGTYAVVASVLAAVALLAGYLPAARASRIDPAVTLRQQ